MKKSSGGFTLVEVLVGCVILVIMLVMLFSMTSQTTSIVRTVSAKVDAFQSGKMAFDTITRRLSQATMNTYWDYYNSSNVPRNPITTNVIGTGSFTPAKYGRRSDLDFLIQYNPTQSPPTIAHYGEALYFAAPEDHSTDTTKDQTQGLLNAIGYYVQYGSDAAYLSPAMSGKAKYRYRMMQAIQPTENFQIYTSSTASTTNAWVTGLNGSTGVNGTAWPIADNVIALIVWPRLSAIQDPTGAVISGSYLYDARVPLTAAMTTFPLQYAQAPPMVQVTMVLIDEASAQRLDTNSSTEPAVISSALDVSGTASHEKLFTDVTQYTSDLQILTGSLSAAHINYQVLSSVVNLRESKWSAQ